MTDRNYWANALTNRASRRRVLRGAALGGVGLAGAALIGCGSSDDDTGVATATASAGGNATTEGTTDPLAEIKRGGTLKNSYTNDPPVINPYGSASFRAKGNAAYAYSRLYKIAARPDANPYSVGAEEDLAESAETEDGQHWVVKLKPGIKFHNVAPVNGRVLTTDDVIASFEALTAETSPSRTQVSSWTNVDAVDDSTLSFTLASPSGTFLTDLADTNTLMVMPREAFTGGFDPALRMIGTGPWVLDEYRTSVSLKWSRNPDYWDQPRPYVDSLESVIIPEYANSLAQFRAGNLHYLAIQSDDVLGLRRENDEIQWRGLLPALLSFLYFSPEKKSPNAPWRDERFRQAVSMMLDRNALTELGYNVRALQDAGLDVGVQWNNVVPAGWGDWWLDPQGTEIGEAGQYFQFNPGEAATLLAASGYDGAEIPFIFANDIYGATFNRIAEATAGFLAEVGLNLVVRTQPYTSEYFPQTFAGNFDGIAFGYETPFPEVGGYFPRLFGDDPNNHGQIHDDRITELSELQAVELDPEQRRQYIHEIQKVSAEHMYYVPNQAGAGTAWTGFRPEVRGISQTRGYGLAAETLPEFWLDA